MISQKELMTKQHEVVNQHNAQMSAVMTIIGVKLAGTVSPTVTPSKSDDLIDITASDL